MSNVEERYPIIENMYLAITSSIDLVSNFLETTFNVTILAFGVEIAR